MARGRENPSRFWGLALGPYDNYQVKSSNLISITAGAADTTPSVAGISILYSNTGGSYRITQFDDGAEGQLLILVNEGSQMRLETSGVLKVATDALAAMTNITLLKHGSSWFELSQSINLA